jgi:hypothetical protein
MIPERFGRTARAVATVWLATLSSAVLAEPGDERGVEVRVGLEAPPRELIAGLNAGLRAWDVRVLEQWVERSCAPIVARTDIRASVSLNWDVGGPVSICFSTQTRSFRREVGPFDSLHARAREAVVTIVEAGLEALMEPDAGAQDAADAGGLAGLAADPSTATASFPSVPPPRVIWPVTKSVSTRPAAWTLGVGYAPALWDEDVVAQGVSASATRSIDADRLFHVGPRVLYVPAVHVDHNGVGVVARELQAELMLVLVAPLLAGLALEVSLAPGLRWLAVDPDSYPSAEIYDVRSRVHLGPVVTAQLGPRLAVASWIMLSAQIGCSAMPQAQRYGYTRDGDFVAVLEVQPIRLSFELGARIGL